MAATALTYAPENGLITSSTVALDVTYRYTPGVADVDIGIWVNSTRVARYVGGTLTPIAGYAGTVTVVGDVITIHVTKDTAWSHNTPVAWYSTYQDASTALLTEATRRFVYASITPNTIVPTEYDDFVSTRPTMYFSFDFSLGTGIGVDLVIAGIRAQYPEYSIAEGGGSTRSYVQATPRRSYPEAQQVQVIASPKVRYSGVDYHGYYATTFTPKGMGTPVREAPTFAGPFSSVLGESLRRLVSAHLVLRATSPGIRAVVTWLLHHSSVGALVRRTFPLKELQREDLPGETAINAFVQAATPLWAASVANLAPGESQETLEEFWRSNHPIERAACLCVLVAYASGEVR